MGRGCGERSRQSAGGRNRRRSGSPLLPLELREVLLIVVLAGFTHQRGGGGLDISLATLIARLSKARERVAALTHSPAAAEAAPRAIRHLRVVK